MRARLAVLIAAIAAIFLSLSLITVSSVSAQVTQASPLSRAETAQAARAHARPAAPGTYTVRPGDTLGAIAARLCGSAADYPGLASASGIADPDRIYPGQRITLRCSAAGTARRAGRALHLSARRASVSYHYRGIYSFTALERLWTAAGGGDAWSAAKIAECESGGNPRAYNPSGASGLWQILGLPFPGDPFDPWTNARMGVFKWRQAGGFSPWVCTAAHRDGAGTVRATLASYTGSAGGRALDWAEAHALGHWYGWGGTGPAVYDCSGLVVTAYAHQGITLPRTTYGMLSSPHLHRIGLGQARRGDLLFYGSGHVELATAWYHVSFGAHDSGSRVGWIRWGGYWAPTMAFRVW